jgi:hypothetical protein
MSLRWSCPTQRTNLRLRCFQLHYQCLNQRSRQRPNPNQPYRPHRRWRKRLNYHFPNRGMPRPRQHLPQS